MLLRLTRTLVRDILQSERFPLIVDRWLATTGPRGTGLFDALFFTLLWDEFRVTITRSEIRLTDGGLSIGIDLLDKLQTKKLVMIWELARQCSRVVLHTDRLDGHALVAQRIDVPAPTRLGLCRAVEQLAVSSCYQLLCEIHVGALVLRGSGAVCADGP